MGPIVEQVAACLVELIVQFPEVVVNRGSPKYAHALILPLIIFKGLCLDDDAEAFYKEYAAKNGEQELFVNDDSTNTNNSANHQRSCVAHEHLGGVGIIPKETYHRTNEGAEEYHEFL